MVDVGAAGQIMPRWKRIEKYLNYYGFEPDDRSRERLLAQKNECLNYTLDEKIVSSEECLKEIHLCKAPMTSSIYEPNREYIEKFSEADRFDIISKEKISRYDN